MEIMRKIHLINDVGQRIEVSSSEFSDNLLLGENKYSTYDIDVNWYLKTDI